MTEFTNCAKVWLRGGEYYLAGNPITVTNSNVWITDCAVVHDYPFPWAGPPTNTYTQSTPGLVLNNSEATIVGSVIEGGGTTSMSLAKPAVELVNSTLQVGPSSTIVGGVNGSNPTSYWLAYHANNPSTSYVYVDPRAAVVPPLPLAPPKILTTIDATFHSWVVAGQDFGVSVAGPADGFAVLMLGNMTPLPSATTLGSLVIEPLTVTFLDLVALPPVNGFRSWIFHCPTAAPLAHAFAFQSLTLSPTGALGLTLPSPFTVGWPHGQIP